MGYMFGAIACAFLGGAVSSLFWRLNNEKISVHNLITHIDFLKDGFNCTFKLFK